ncbi:hypothetical protein NE236_32235 [Actinoallomurus purpureus]|uniref:hypothetical protein n=1 Tax=Actinoallomurus purpureus TaxID=478114 RepID=UPI00209294A5|nr:hypothetical protein [Actinoallomurus purpureus]MCO6009652.1 hypothetical protein [Actinoallomurus purpureus]
MKGVGIAALVMWILAAVAGSYLFIVNGGLRRQGTKITRFPVTVVLGHPALALVALATWVEFLLTAQTAYAWSSFGVLAVVALLGFILLTRWLTGRGGKHARGAEQEFPLIGVLAHGTVAILTFVLVLFTAIRVSRG